MMLARGKGGGGEVEEGKAGVGEGMGMERDFVGTQRSVPMMFC